jgi:hypothetical protein
MREKRKEAFVWHRAPSVACVMQMKPIWIVCSRRNEKGSCVWQSKAKEGLSVADEATKGWLQFCR